MPSWFRLLDVDRLAEAAADIEFAIPLEELSGLRALRASIGGKVSGHLRFARERGFPLAQLTLSGRATLECQRCMRPVERVLDAQVTVALITSEADAARVPQDLEPVLAEGGRISVGALVTEELLLTLPIVPLHEDGCARAAAAQPQGGETHRPFARLAELLKRQI